MISRHNRKMHSNHTISITNRNYLQTGIAQNKNRIAIIMKERAPDSGKIENKSESECRKGKITICK